MLILKCFASLHLQHLLFLELSSQIFVCFSLGYNNDHFLLCNNEVNDKTLDTGKHYYFWLILILYCKSHCIHFLKEYFIFCFEGFLWIRLLLICGSFIGTCLCLIKRIGFWDGTNKLAVYEKHSENRKCKAAFIELDCWKLSFLRIMRRVNKK